MFFSAPDIMLLRPSTSSLLWPGPKSEENLRKKIFMMYHQKKGQMLWSWSLLVLVMVLVTIDWLLDSL